MQLVLHHNFAHEIPRTENNCHANIWRERSLCCRHAQ